jgi:fluoroacetyl-CoA thioesterase
MTPEPGSSASSGCTVTEADTVAALGSGEVPVLATPQVLALAEQATAAAIAGERDRRHHLDLPGRIHPRWLSRA